MYEPYNSSYFPTMAPPMDRNAAAILAIRALTWLAAGPHMSAFLASTGLGEADLRRRAGEPELLASVLEFVLSNDVQAEEFCTAESVPARDLHVALHALAGAQ